MTEPIPPDEPRSWRPDFVVIGLIVLALAILLIVTFDIWAPGH